MKPPIPCSPAIVIQLFYMTQSHLQKTNSGISWRKKNPQSNMEQSKHAHDVAAQRVGFLIQTTANLLMCGSEAPFVFSGFIIRLNKNKDNFPI